MLKTISTSDLRVQMKRVLNEVGYGRAQYVVEKFGEPTAAIISMEDFRFLQTVRQREREVRLRDLIARIRERHRDLNLEELDALIEEARGEFYRLQGHQPDVNESGPGYY